MTNKSRTTVDSAYEGEFGWVWINDNWVMARVNEDLLATYPADYLTQYFDLNDETRALPWYSISQPPFDGNEKELTHVVIRDKDLSVTVSVNLKDEAQRDEFFRVVHRAALDFAGVKGEKVKL